MKFFDKVKEVFSKKKWVRVTAYIVSALIIVLIVCYFFLGHIVKGSIQTVGPLITGVPITVRSVSVDIFGDVEVGIKDLVVGNPQGYSSPHALELKKFQVIVKPLSLFKDKIVVDKLEITGVEVNFETNVVASNLNDINNNVKKFTPSTDGKKSESKPAKLQVNAIDMSDIKVRVIAKGGNAAGVPLVMVPIHMKDLGTGPDGITVSGLIGEMLTKLFTGVTSLVSSGAGAVADGVSSAGKAVGNAAKDAGSAVGDAGKNLGKQVKGLFTSGKKDAKAGDKAGGKK